GSPPTPSRPLFPSEGGGSVPGGFAFGVPPPASQVFTPSFSGSTRCARRPTRARITPVNPLPTSAATPPTPPPTPTLPPLRAPLPSAGAGGSRQARGAGRGLLAGRGRRGGAVENGRQLVELCRACLPAVVLTAGQLPDLDGIAVAGRLAADRPVPVILLSDRQGAEIPPGPQAHYVLGHPVPPVKAADLRAAPRPAPPLFRQFPAPP